MVGEPGQDFRIEMVEPGWHRPVLAKPEQQMVGQRVYLIVLFNRRSKEKRSF